MSDHADDGFEVYDSNAMEWGELFVEQLGKGIPVKAFTSDPDKGIPVKAFTSDPDTGMMCLLIKYKAGFINPWHSHNCAHGIYVLSGTLRTHKGDFSAGTFVWLPEGMKMYHGATEEADCVALFVTNKAFDIRFAFEDQEEGSEAYRTSRERALLTSMESVT